MAESFLERMRNSSHLSGGNVGYVEALFESFLEDPNAVPEEWREYFDKLPTVAGAIDADIPHSTVIKHFEILGRNRLRARPETVSTDISSEHERKQMREAKLQEERRRQAGLITP